MIYKLDYKNAVCYIITLYMHQYGWYPCVYASMYECVSLSYFEMFLNTMKPKQSYRRFADDISKSVFFIENHCMCFKFHLS